MATKPKLGKVMWNLNERISLPSFFLSEKYIENLIHKNVCYLSNFPWGFDSIDVDLSEISAGRIGLLNAQGIMPDGVPFDIPHNDQLPLSVSVNINLFKEEGLTIYLAYPLNQHEMSFKGFYKSTRFTSAEIELDGKSFSVAVNNFILLIGDTEISKHVCLPIAKIDKVNADGSIEVSSAFVAPCFSLLKNKAALKVFTELHSFIQQKARQLSELFLNQNSSGSVAPQITDSLMLQLLNKYDAYCKNVASGPSTHPHNFYNEMVLFSSELATYTAPDKLSPNFMPYKHIDSEVNFTEITIEIKEQLDVSIERDAVEVRLKRNKHGTFDSIFMPPELLESCHYILCVSAKRDKNDIKKYIPGQCKISARSAMDMHIRSLSTGVHLEPLSAIPPSIPYKHDFVSFQLRFDENSFDSWQQIFNEKTISIHITGDYPEITLSLWLVKKDKING